MRASGMPQFQRLGSQTASEKGSVRQFLEAYNCQLDMCYTVELASYIPKLGMFGGKKGRKEQGMSWEKKNQDLGSGTRQKIIALFDAQ